MCTPTRGTNTARGYDAAWTRLRAQHAAAFPLCARCWGAGRIQPLSDVDHIQPFHGRTDPRRLDPRNLQSLCRRCHADKTAADQRRGGGGEGKGSSPAPPQTTQASTSRDRVFRGG
jgi:5-methylcytosine-specific restriction protein A